MKCFTASLGTETNTFSPMLTSRASFEEDFYVGPGQHPDRPTLFAGPLWAARKRIASEGWQVVEGTCTFAQPAGITTRDAYETLRDEILDQLRAAMPVDIVLMGLHGAMVADGYDDCEGDLLARIREIVGPRVPIGAELDPHCHMTKKRLAAADILVCFKEFPHIDFVERGEELTALIGRMAKGEVKPVASVYDCRMINLYPTTRQPMRGFVDKIQAMEGKDGVLSISIAHGFPYADVPEIGTRIVVYTDDRKAFGDQLAETLGREMIGFRDEAYPPVLAMDDALDRAVARNQGLVVITDPTDNAGGGAPGDSTFILRRMLERKIGEAAFGPIWDPIAVRMCFNAGEGTRFRLRFGGKMGPGSGDPIDAEVVVTKLVRNATQTFGDALAEIGDAAAIEVDGIAVVLITNRQQAFGTDLFTNLGIDLAAKRVCAVKSTNHFYASYSRMAEEVLYTGAPAGTLTLDFKSIPYTRVQRPIWPLDADPWTQDSPR